MHVQNCNGISWQYLFIGAAIIAGLSSVEWGSVNSVGHRKFIFGALWENF